ncbi:26S proteasome non-ATPase regulatory subunit 13A [Artemisia annua]|uniref:26S proteasome non-ATPase regulatory subunit 13A n=1 Tax=Artemisia annua TaxID=35608 RepID=A0A2U1PQS4_ARTAN|nr:26S proteasome non-ATPase regulatory subunit 13A [Artemisia annua]
MDQPQVERERGITIKAQTATIFYNYNSKESNTGLFTLYMKELFTSLGIYNIIDSIGSLTDSEAHTSHLNHASNIVSEWTCVKDIVLKLHDSFPILKQGEVNRKLLSLADDFDDVLSFTESRKGTIRNKAKKGKVQSLLSIFAILYLDVCLLHCGAVGVLTHFVVSVKANIPMYIDYPRVMSYSFRWSHTRKNFLLYLTYTSVESLSDSFKLDLAFDLFLSALLGENIYNFGELLAHPIIGFDR